MIVEFFLPLLIISVTYSRLSYHLWGNKTPGIAQDTRDQVLLGNKKKVNVFPHNRKNYEFQNKSQINFKTQLHYLVNNSLFILDNKDARDSRWPFCSVLDTLADMANHLSYYTKC